MCLILLARSQHPKYPFLFGCNRDEFYARPTDAAHWWPDAPSVLAGRDRVHGGTWMGVRKDGIFAMLTNFRDGRKESGKRSRGHIVADFLKSPEDGGRVLQELRRTRDETPGYNLLFGSVLGEIFFYSSVEDRSEELKSGIFGLSNAGLDTPWPKVRRVKERLKSELSSIFSESSLFTILGDRELAPDEELPATGVPLEWERVLSAPFIEAKEGNYGTRSSTVGLLSRDGTFQFFERTFSLGIPEPSPVVAFSWTLEPGRADLFGVERKGNAAFRKDV